MALLGSSVDPRLFLQDYSGFTRAAEMNAQAMQGLGQNIGKAISDYGDLKKEQKKVDAYNKASAQAIEAGLTLGKAYGVTGVEESLRPFLDAASDPSLSPIEKAAALEQGKAMLPMVFGRYDRSQDVQIQDSAYKAKIEAAKAKQIAELSKAPSVLDVNVPGGTIQSQYDPQTQSYVPIRTTGLELSAPSESLFQNLPDPLKPLAQTFVEEGAKNNIAPEILAAIAIHETAGGTSSAFKNKNNAMGISDSSGPIKLASPEESIARMANLLGKGINEGVGPYANAKSIADIASVYAPVGAGNDPRNLNQFWTQSVAANIEKLSQPSAQSGFAGKIGFAPVDQAKQKQGTLMTQDQVRQLTSQGFKVSGSPDPSGGLLVTGVQSLSPQKGQETIVNPDGTVTIRDIITGGKQEGIKQAQEDLKSQGIRIVSSATEDALSKLDSVATNNPLLAAAGSIVAQALPATEKGEFAKNLSVINNQNSFATVQQLRASSPTGGAAGNMTEKEWPRFETRFFPLDINSTKDSLEKGLKLNLLNAFEAANGTPDEAIKSLNDKKITQRQYDDYVKEYLTTRSIANVDSNGIPGKAYDWTRLNKELINKSNTFAAPSSGISISPAAQSVIDKYR